jgi:hypothetical protein
MKSSFLQLLVLGAIATAPAWAQTKKTKPVKANAPVAAPAPVAPTPSVNPVKQTSFEKFYDRLKIGYFGAFQSPHFDDMRKGQWRNAAISPTWGKNKNEGKNQDTYATNVFNQVSFRVKSGGKLDFVVNPRFTLMLGSARDEGHNLILIEDVLVGVQGVVAASEDKKFNLWIRPAVRVPTSRGSRATGNGGAGTTTHQLELAFLPTYDFNSTWQIGWFGQIRQWTIEDRYSLEDRLRIISAPYVQYAFDPKSRLQVYYQNFLESDQRAKPVEDRKLTFIDRWQDVMIGYNRDVTEKLNLFPFVGFFVDDVPHSMKSGYIGAWISYTIK